MFILSSKNIIIFIMSRRKRDEEKTRVGSGLVNRIHLGPNIIGLVLGPAIKSKQLPAGVGP